MSETRASGFRLLGDVSHPEARCRGCAGIGVGQHVPPRTIQVIEGVQGYQWRLNQPPFASPRARERYVRVTPHFYDQRREQCVFHGPYAAAFKVYEKFLAQGFILDDACLPMEAEWACRWCHGTGQPQLSVGTLEAMLRG